MIYEKIGLKKYYPKLKYDPILEIMSPEVGWSPKGDADSPIRPLMIVLAGGAYFYCSHREMDPVATSYMNRGFVTATIKYTCKPDIKKGDTLYPHPQLEVIAAIDYLRKHAKKFRFSLDKVSLVGFSAGGHLLASIGAYYDKYAKQLGLSVNNVKPNAIVLGYPVIDFMNQSNSRTNLINDDKKLFNYLSIDLHVSKKYPPTFIWCTNDDPVVPSSNTRNMSKALKKANVKHKMVIFPHGPHGLSTMDANTNRFFQAKDLVKAKGAKAWIDMSVKFLEEVYKSVKD